jgi:hypothetical protein
MLNQNSKFKKNQPGVGNLKFTILQCIGWYLSTKQVNDLAQLAIYNLRFSNVSDDIFDFLSKSDILNARRN